MSKREGLKKRFVFLTMLLLVIAITVALLAYRDKVAELGSYGYLGAFLLGLVGNATLFVPSPTFLLLFALGATFNPILVGLAGATGGIIGEISGFLAGYSGRGMVPAGRMYARAEGWMKRWGAWTIFVFAVAPFLLFDVAGLVAGALRFPLWKFLLVGWLGKTIKYIGVLVAGTWGWEAVLRYFT